MILAQDRRDPVVIEILLEARLHDALLSYADALRSDPDYIAKEILRDHLTAQNGVSHDKERKRKR